jgi:hypothetical protein
MWPASPPVASTLKSIDKIETAPQWSSWGSSIPSGEPARDRYIYYPDTARCRKASP